jgi:membrane associated rhomboid family serine protease
MAQVRVEMLSRDLVLDVCKRCPAIWFDANELDAVPVRPPTAIATEAAMSPEARAALAILEVRHGAERERTAVDSGQFGPDETWQWIPAILGWPVELGAPQTRRRPWVTWGLIVACCLAFIPVLGERGSPRPGFLWEWGFIPSQWERHGFVTLVTSFFLHGGVFHLLGNMWALWTFGDNAEDRLGVGLYALMIGAGHLAGTLLQAAFDPRGDLPCVGASDGISAVIAFYAISFPKVRIGILFWWRWIRLPVMGAVMVYAGIQILGAYAQSRGLGGGVSHLGHVGGLAVGAVAAWWYCQAQGEGFDRRHGARGSDRP